MAQTASSSSSSAITAWKDFEVIWLSDGERAKNEPNPKTESDDDYFPECEVIIQEDPNVEHSALEKRTTKKIEFVVCRNCLVAFSCLSALVRHMLEGCLQTKVKDGKVFAKFCCPVCQLYLHVDRKSSLLHLLRCVDKKAGNGDSEEDPTIVAEIERARLSKKYVISMQTSSGRVKHTCFQCSFTSYSKNDVLLHCKLNHEEACRECGHLSCQQATDSLLVCPICEFESRAKHDFWLHQAKGHGACAECGFGYCMDKNRKRKLLCKMCGRSAENMHRMWMHFRESHQSLLKCVVDVKRYLSKMVTEQMAIQAETLLPNSKGSSIGREVLSRVGIQASSNKATFNIQQKATAATVTEFGGKNEAYTGLSGLGVKPSILRRRDSKPTEDFSTKVSLTALDSNSAIGFQTSNNSLTTQNLQAKTKLDQLVLCPLCGYRFRTRLDCQIHVKLAHGAARDNTSLMKRSNEVEATSENPASKRAKLDFNASAGRNFGSTSATTIGKKYVRIAPKLNQNDVTFRLEQTLPTFTSSSDQSNNLFCRPLVIRSVANSHLLFLPTNPTLTNNNIQVLNVGRSQISKPDVNRSSLSKSEISALMKTAGNLMSNNFVISNSENAKSSNSLKSFGGCKTTLSKGDFACCFCDYECGGVEELNAHMDVKHV